MTLTPKPSLSPADRVAIFMATGAGIGRVPYAPGTFGSLPGIALGWAIYALAKTVSSNLYIHMGLTAVLLLVTAAVALWAIARMEAALATHDDPSIVIDEIAGQAIAVAMLAPNLWSYAAAFVLFRILDITKPSLIGRLDREVAGAAGTLSDDLLAGVVAGAALLAIQALVL